jgi:hypothetical protein
VLETESRRKKKSWLCTAKRLLRSGAPDCPVVHRTVSGAPGCLGLKTPLSGICRRRTAKIHRTVRCAPDCPVSQQSAEPTVGRGICARHVVWPTVGRRHRTVRCAPDCPVRPTTEGKDGLPDLFSTAPSCLGAIKGTPRRMEEITKHSYNIPKHQDIDLTHSFHCDSI